MAVSDIILLIDIDQLLLLLHPYLLDSLRDGRESWVAGLLLGLLASLVECVRPSLLASVIAAFNFREAFSVLGASHTWYEVIFVVVVHLIKTHAAVVIIVSIEVQPALVGIARFVKHRLLHMAIGPFWEKILNVMNLVLPLREIFTKHICDVLHLNSSMSEGMTFLG